MPPLPTPIKTKLKNRTKTRTSTSVQRRPILIIFCIAAFCQLIHAQTGYGFKILGEKKMEASEFDSAAIYVNKAMAAYQAENQPDSALLMTTSMAAILHRQKKSKEAIGILDEAIMQGLDKEMAKDILLNLYNRKASITASLFDIKASEEVLKTAAIYVDTLDGISETEADNLLQWTWIKLRRYQFADALIDAKKGYFAIRQFYTDKEKKTNGYLQVVSYLHSQLRQMDSAEVYTIKYVDNALAIYPKDHFYHGLAYNQLGTLYQGMRQFDKTIAAYKKGERIARLVANKGDSRLLGAICNNLANTFSLCSEADLALNYAKEGHERYLQSFGENNIALRSSLTELSDIYVSLEDYENGYKTALKAYEIQMANEPEDKSSVAYTKNFLAKAMFHYGQQDEAKKLLHENINAFDSSVGSTAYSIGSYLHLGQFYLEEKNADSAFYYNNYVLQENLKELSKFHLENIKQYGKLGEAFAEVAPEKANNYFDTTAAYLAYMEKPADNFASMVPHFLPDILAAETIFSKLNLLWNGYKQMQDKAKLYEILSITDAYVEYFVGYLSVIRGESSLNEISAKNADILDYALLASNELKILGEDKSDALIKYSELSRDILYKLFVAHHNVNQVKGIPDKLIEKNNSLAAKLRVEKEYLQDVLRKDSSINMGPFTSAIEDYQQFKNELKASHPAYHKAMFGLQTLAAKEIQSQMPSNQKIIQYTFLTEGIMVQVLGKNDFKTTILPAAEITTNVFSLIAAVKERKENKALHQALFEQLLAPIYAGMDDTELIIIPDGALHYLNFEFLINKSSGKYLIEDHQISYASSIGQYLHGDASSSQMKNRLAFAPGFSSNSKDSYRSQIDTSLWDQKYLTAIQQPFTVSLTEELNKIAYTSYTDVDAIEQNFKVKAPTADVLFIGTHGYLNDRNPTQSYLQFTRSTDSSYAEDDRLYTSEIYGLDLNAALVLLSACNTGIGELREGEGMISLAHAFNNAGCSNIVHSLWSIDEASSVNIEKRFLNFYAEGEDASSALRRAKLDYLQEADPALKDPYYWGGLILKAQLTPRGSTTKWWVMGGVLLLGLLGVWRWARRVV